MKLSKDEIALLREVFAWARGNSVRSTEVEKGDCARCRVWTSTDGSREVHVWDRLESTDDLGVFVKRNNCSQGLEVRDVREIVDVLCAMQVLPLKFSSAWAAGRESVGRPLLLSNVTCFEVQVWWSDGGTDEWDHHGSEEGAINSARRKVGAGTSEIKVVRSEARSFELHRYQVNEKVLGRFGDWGSVDAD